MREDEEGWGTFSILRPVVMVGWRDVGIQGRPVTWHLFSRKSFQCSFKVDLEEWSRALLGWAEKNRWGSLTLLPSQLICVPT